MSAPAITDRRSARWRTPFRAPARRAGLVLPMSTHARVRRAVGGYSKDVASVDHGVGRIFGPAMTIGVGLGGFVDGIVLHQILGWHHVLSARAGVDLRANEVADGVFHAASWVILLAGVVWLYRRLRQPPVAAAWPRLDAGPRPWRALVGPMLMGWGLFNLVEGLVDHHLLGLHHVRPGPGQLGWDIGFLASGVAIAGLGFLLARRGPVSPTQPADAAPGPPTT
jgi:uncharacterized membrane protein